MVEHDPPILSSEQLAVTISLNMHDSELRRAVDQLSQLAALTARAPMALAAIEERDGTYLTVDAGICASWITVCAQPFLQAVSLPIIGSPEPITDHQLDQDQRNEADHLLRGLGVTTWAAVPLFRYDERALGILCVFDTSPREWADDEIQGLSHTAAVIESAIKLCARGSSSISHSADSQEAECHGRGGNGYSLTLPQSQTASFHRSYEHIADRAAQSEQRYRSLFAFNLDAVFAIDLQGDITDANPACETLTGYSVDELRHISFAPLIVPCDQHKAREIFRTALSGTPQHWDVAIHRRDGQRRDIRGTSVPIEVDNEIVGVFGICQDVTERKRAEAALHETQEKLLFQQSLLTAQGEASTDGFMVVSENGEILAYNHRFTEMWQIPQEIMETGSILEARQAVLDKLVDPDEFVQRALHLYHHPDEHSQDEVLLKGGRIFDRHSAPVRSCDGKHFGRVWYYRDVTDTRQAEKLLLEQSRRLESLVTFNPDLVATLDFQGVFLTINPAVTATLGYSKEELVGQPFTVIVDPDDHDAAWERIAQLAQGETPSLDITVHHQAGHTVDLSVQGIPIIIDHAIMGFWVIAKDITQVKQLVNQLQQSEARLAEAQRIAGVGSWEWDLSTNLLRWSDECYRLLGFSPDRETLTFEMFMEAVHPEDREAITTAISDSLNKAAPYATDMRITLPDGGERGIHAQGEVTFDESGRPVKMAGTVLDITERKTLESELAYRADHDQLTGLANRYLLSRRLEEILKDTRTPHAPASLLLIDLDDFKSVNDSLGHDAGDELLITVAERLRGCVRHDDTVARLGGDEFIILLEHITGEKEFAQVSERVIQALQQPITVNGVGVSITPSIGIVPYIFPPEALETVLKHADLAVYHAKQQGKARYELFSPTLRNSSRDRLQVQNELRDAIEQEAFTLQYQPLIRLDSGESVGAEALLRWDSPTVGSVPPSEFIPIAENCGLITPIGQWVIREAGCQLHAWNETLPNERPLMMSVNLSPLQLLQHGFVESIESLLQDSGVDPKTLCFEITETSMVAADGDAPGILSDLKSLGITLAIDDFGTGHSSLSYLKDLPIDWLKVDRVFIDQLRAHDESSAILMAVIQLAHALEIQVAAEGVETAEQLSIVSDLGCDMAQGYYIAHPASSEETLRYLINSSNKQRVK